jgi:molecular chaperone GrpE
VRLQADFENFRRRTLRERQELYGRATGDVLLELLPVLDHLELALEAAAAHDADHSVVEGFRLVADQLRGVLDRFGLKAVPGVGHPFDHAVHEAVHQAPSDEHGEGVVMMELRRGYQSGPRLLRAAQVIVSSGPPAPSGEDDAVPAAEGT